MLSFPAKKEKRLRNSPLSEVICQIRFPPLLSIVNEYPVAFQESIRACFPNLSTHQAVTFDVKPLAEAPPKAEPEPPVFRFRSSDDNLTASLGVNFYALSTTAYTHWPEFLDHLLFLDRAARDAYELLHATRIGLRYINHITLENTGTTDLPELWSILRSELTMLLRTDAWEGPQKALTQLTLSGDEGESLNLRTGFTADDYPFLLLDLDYYSVGTIDFARLEDICEHHHDILYRAFRWCIRDDRLHVFDPFDVDEED